ncbi:FG-GAP-like repeat-containing protein [Nocardioides sp. R-C-SC26]|uniref:FG-GAP-like repeat-containing protein n=1 Tax=Nocardioides sp. R-C-SC26 TaxID=2870414 RepID=UPI001E3273F9|nr:N-acetylmuramoyl-L-alanine amidase [Nocardioides sp. R-C-SC26]
MSSRHSRFVTMCQQMLVLGVVCAAITPAATMLSLDLVPSPSADRAHSVGAGGSTALAAYVAANSTPSVVPDAVVEPVVHEYALTPPEGARIAARSLATTARRVVGGSAELLSTPQPVSGYGAVGVTWAHGTDLEEDDISVEVRTQDGDDWSDWSSMEYHDEHGPDPDTREALRARPGTDEMLVGRVDQVQVRVSTRSAAPPDLKLAVIDPGVETTHRRERAAIDTGDLPAPAMRQGGESAPSAATENADVPVGEDSPEVPASEPDLSSSDGDLNLAAAAFTPKPVIYSRAQWGADESMRDASSLRYYEVHAGFVHHTVNANDYKAKDVPAILRGIYAYHTKSRGWSDIGYNYLVDRFGRIWEGRFGGVDRPVVGAHTLGYNDGAFAMSAIGNYEIAQPSQAMIQAYGALFAWKLSLHGVRAGSAKQWVVKKNFRAINGHRDAASTACPGKYLYAKLPEIRKLAAQAQVGFTGRQLESNLASTPHPDIVVRRASDGQGFIIPLKPAAQAKKKKGSANAAYKAGKPIQMGVNFSGDNRILNVGDWDRDGYSDVVSRRKSDGALFLRRGLGNGAFAPVQRLATGFGKVGLLAAVGDMTGDGWPDLIGQPKGGKMMIYPGLGLQGLGAPYVAYSAVQAQRQVGVGLWGPDGAPDTLMRKGKNLQVFSGNGPGGLTGARTLDVDLSSFDWVVGISDIAMAGHPDLVLRTKKTGQLWLVNGTPTGVEQPQLLGTGMEIYDMVG